MRGKNRLLTGVALSLLVMGGTGDEALASLVSAPAVAQQPRFVSTMNVSIDDSHGTIDVYRGIRDGMMAFGFVPGGAVASGLMDILIATVETGSTVSSSASFRTAAGDMLTLSLAGDPDPFLLLIQGYTDVGTPSSFLTSTGVVPIDPVFGLAKWSRNATIDVLRGNTANAVKGERSGLILVGDRAGEFCDTCVVEMDINGVPADFLLPRPVSTPGSDDDPLPEGAEYMDIIDCGVGGCTGLSLTFGAIGPGATGDGVPGSFTVQAVSILQAIPEPFTLSPFAMGLLGLGGVLRRLHMRTL